MHRSVITPVCAKGLFPLDDNCVKSSLLIKTRLTAFRVFNQTRNKNIDFLHGNLTVNN